MKQLFLLLAAVVLSFGFGACADNTNNSTPSHTATHKPVPPGSGGRGDTPGIHAESQNPR
jgi:hypothetical protein